MLGSGFSGSWVPGTTWPVRTFSAAPVRKGTYCLFCASEKACAVCACSFCCCAAASAAARSQKEQAQTAQAFSEAQNKQYVPLRTGAALNVRTGQVVPGTQLPEKPDPNMTPQNLYAVALKDLTDTDPTDPSYPIKQAKVQQLQDGITGLQKQPQSHEPNEWDIRTKAAQGDPTAQAILNGKQKEKQDIRVPRQPTDYDIWKSNPQQLGRHEHR